MGSNHFKSIRIEYEITGKHQKGVEIFIQKDKKTIRKLKIDTKILDKTYSENTLEIDDGSIFVRIDLINKIGIQLPSLNSLKQEMINKNPQFFDSNKNNPLNVTPPKGLLNKTEKILDKECKVYFFNNRFIYIWQEILLQEIFDMFEKSTKRAIKLDIDIPIDDSEFQIPADIKFQSKKTIENLTVKDKD